MSYQDSEILVISAITTKQGITQLVSMLLFLFTKCRTLHFSPMNIWIESNATVYRLWNPSNPSPFSVLYNPQILWSSLLYPHLRSKMLKSAGLRTDPWSTPNLPPYGHRPTLATNVQQTANLSDSGTMYPIFPSLSKRELWTTLSNNLLKS